MRRLSLDDPVRMYLKEELMFAGSIGPVGYFSLMLSNISQVEQAVKQVKKIVGVRNAQAYVLQDIVLNSRHFEKERLPAISRMQPLIRPTN